MDKNAIESRLAEMVGILDKLLNVDDIDQSLTEFPELIQGQKTYVRKLRDEFQEADLPRKMMEIEMIDAIGMEKDTQTGKALYSNDKLRDAELKRRKANNPEYQDLNDEARIAERALAAAEDELVAREQRFIAYQHVSKLVTAEINLLAGMMDWAELPRMSAEKNDKQAKQPY